MDALAKALAVLWGKINAALGRSQAEQARAQQSDMTKMDADIVRALVSVTLEPDAHVHVKVATKADRLTWLLERRIVSPRAVLILLQAESPVVRREAACALTPLAGEPTVRDALRKCLKDPDWWVRCAAIDALAQHAGEPRSEDCQSGPQGQSSQ